MKDMDFIEKREFLRVDYEAVVHFSVFTNDMLRKMPRAITKNVSACGILFSSEDVIPVGTLVAIELNLQTVSHVIEIDDTVFMVEGKILGRIVRVEELVSGSFDIGVCFIRSKQASDKKINELLKKLV